MTPLRSPPSPPAPEQPGVPRRFAPRAVGFEEFMSLVQETWTLLAVAPARLCGLFLLVFFPIQLLSSLPYAAMPLRFAIASVGLAGFYAVLESLRQGRPAVLRDMFSPWRLPADKVILLVVAGLLPLVGLLLVWWADLGWDTVDAFLGGQVPPEGFPLRQEIEFVVVTNLLGAPLMFVQPLCVMHSWTASRSLAANLLAFAANWRWGLVLALVALPIALAIDALDPADILLSLVAEVAAEMALGAFTLVLLQRSLR